MPRSASSHKEGDDGRYCDNGPGDRDRKKASRLATHLAKMLDPTTARVAAPTRTVELRVIAIDISIKNCGKHWPMPQDAAARRYRSGRSAPSRGGLGSARIKCLVAGARKGKASLGRQSYPGLVHREGHNHPEEALAILQVPGTGTCTGYVRIRRGPKTPVLQVRRKRTSCQRLSCLGTQVPPVRVARGFRQPQEG